MDPLFLLPSIIPVGVVIHKKIKANREEASHLREISYFNAEGRLEFRTVRAADVDEHGNSFDSHGFRIGFSPHYTRKLEIEITGTGLTICNCTKCVSEAEDAARREKERAEQIRRIERKQILEKIRLEQKMRDDEENDRRRLEKIRLENELRQKFRSGKMDHLSVRQLIREGVSKEMIQERIGGRIVWPEYAITGAKEVTFEKKEILDNIVTNASTLGNYVAQVIEPVYKYYKITKTYFPNGDIEHLRVEIDQDSFNEKAAPRILATKGLK